MKNITRTAVIFLLFSTTALAGGKYENDHFSINALVSPNIKGSQPLIMMLPATGGFSPNVNIMVQHFTDSLKEYADLSVRQFKQLNLRTIQLKRTKSHVVFEYSGDMQGRHLHWFAMAYKKGSNVFLITATCPESEWHIHSKTLVACVKSFRLK